MQPIRHVRLAGHAPSQHAAAPDARSTRAVVLKWLRKTHGWIGLWGALLGLLFGGTGILLNHRTILKIPAAQVQESTIQLALPQPAPANPAAMAAWLARSLQLQRDVARLKLDPAKPVAWGDTSVTQPARWSGVFNGPRSGVQFEYWVGNQFVSVRRNDNNGFTTLNNLHRGTGMGIGWILLVDTLAGSISLLSVSGVLLWALMTRKRAVGTAIATLSLLATVALAWQSM